MILEKNPKTRPIYRKLLDLADRVKGKPFPGMRRVRQITSYHCGPAVLGMLFSHLGQKISQKSVVKCLRAQSKIKKVGLTVADLAKASNTLGKKRYAFWRKAGASTSDLDLAINKYNWPVGVEWQGVFFEFADEDNGHYGVVTAVDAKAKILRIADPYSEFAGVDRKFDTKYFTRRWWDENEIKGKTVKDRRMMFVITPKNENWPRKIGMVKMNI